MLHELGHVAGFEDVDPTSGDGAAGDVMLDVLDVGVRRLPNASHQFRFLTDRAEQLLARRAEDQALSTDPLQSRRDAKELQQLLSEIGSARQAPLGQWTTAQQDVLDDLFASLAESRKDSLLDLL